jgi:serine/threonine-protein kinase
MVIGGATTEEEARASLQSRLTALWKIMFWAFVILVASQWVMYEFLYPTVRPQYQDAIYATATAGLGILALLWRGILMRRTLAVRQLDQLDMFFAIGCGVTLGAVALLAYDFPPSHYVCLIYGVFVVFTRAIIVPSTGRWTTLTSIATLAPMILAAFVLAISADVIAPGGMFFAAAAVLAAVTVLLATTGSQLIYGLRQKVTAAMQLGAYTLDRKIGEGGMGAVYRAHHLMLRRPTAVKLLLPDRVGADNIERFEREVQHMSQLTHPNTVAVFDYGRSPDGIFYYAMEYLGGGIDLEKLVRKHGPQPAGRVAHILAQVCGALQEAHDRGIIHRDIKPANIILCERGAMPDVAKVVDFGLVKQITEETGMSNQILLGTPAYLSPEVITGETVGPPADLYGLGAVGFYLLMGRHVFEGKTAVDFCVQHVTASPPPIDAPAPLAELIASCLAKTPKTRPTAAVLARALRALVIEDSWDETHARQWWEDFRDQSAPRALLEDATATITVDLSDRD